MSSYRCMKPRQQAHSLPANTDSPIVPGNQLSLLHGAVKAVSGYACIPVHVTTPILGGKFKPDWP